MLSQLFMMATIVGQAAAGGPGAGLALSAQTKKAHARALAEYRAIEHTFGPRVIAQYQLENERLRDRLQGEDEAIGRTWSLTAGTSRRDPGGRGDGFMSMPLDSPPIGAVRPRAPSLEELKRENFLLKGRLRDRRALNRQVNCLYWSEYPIRAQLASRGVY
jgi:hypothetical protein